MLDIRLLAAFSAVVQNGSVTGAARAMGVTQPAVSAQIGRLEAHVGFELFERVKGRLALTSRGAQFHNQVRTALDAMERLDSAALDIRSGLTESLTIAGHPSASISILPEVTASLMAAHPQARITMVNRSSEGVAAAFKAGAIDVAIAEWPVHIEGLDVRRYSAECVAIMPEGHDLAELDNVTPADLSRFPFIGMSERRMIGQRVREIFIEAGESYEPACESEFFSSICELVRAGAGVSIIDAWSARTFQRAGLLTRPFLPSVSYEIAAFRQAGSPPALSDTFVALLDHYLTKKD